jgi:hypothetical protein
VLHRTKDRSHEAAIELRTIAGRYGPFPGLFYAPKWTRTTTGKSPHKALNLARLPIPPWAQKRGRVYPRAIALRHLGIGAALVRTIDGPCIRPQGALVCEHTFVPRHREAEQGAEQTWI